MFSRLASALLNYMFDLTFLGPISHEEMVCKLILVSSKK